MTTYIPVKNTATAGATSRERGFVFAFDGDAWRNYAWGVGQRHADAGMWVDIDTMAGGPCLDYAAALKVLDGAGLVPWPAVVQPLHIRINACPGKPPIHFYTNDSDSIIRLVNELFGGPRQVVVRTLTPQEIDRRKNVCEACADYLYKFDEMRATCRAKTGRCTALHLDRAGEVCVKGNWNNG